MFERVKRWGFMTERTESRGGTGSAPPFSKVKKFAEGGEHRLYPEKEKEVGKGKRISQQQQRGRGMGPVTPPEGEQV